MPAPIVHHKDLGHPHVRRLQDSAEASASSSVASAATGVHAPAPVMGRLSARHQPSSYDAKANGANTPSSLPASALGLKVGAPSRRGSMNGLCQRWGVAPSVGPAPDCPVRHCNERVTDQQHPVRVSTRACRLRSILLCTPPNAVSLCEPCSIACEIMRQR